MGVNLSELVDFQTVQPERLSGKSLAIDAYNAIYQFLSVIRQPDGTPLKDDLGRVTSHLSGLLSRNANLIELGIQPVYVFDGLPSKLKTATILERNVRRNRAQEEWQQAVKDGDMETAFTKATQSSRITNEIVESSRVLLNYLGIPVVQAPSEGEAQAAHMALKGDVWAASSQDFDALLFGAPRLVRNLTLAGRRKMPGRNEYREVQMEIVHLDQVLTKLQLSREQLIDLCILMGTDFNEGIRGIGPKKSLKLIRENSDALAALRSLGKEMAELEEVRGLFLHHERSEEYNLQARPPEREKVLDMLVTQHNFSENRVSAALDKIEAVFSKSAAKKKQSSLDMF